jgi:hypothetical protein
LFLKAGGKVGIGTTTPGAKLSIHGGLHVGGDSDPGDKNLQVDGNLTLGGRLTVGKGAAFTGDVQFTNKVEIETLAVGGSISERMDEIKTGDWKDPEGKKWSHPDSPIGTYFADRLWGKAAGTLLRAIADHNFGFYYVGWVDALGRFWLAIRASGGK